MTGCHSWVWEIALFDNTTSRAQMESVFLSCCRVLCFFSGATVHPHLLSCDAEQLLWMIHFSTQMQVKIFDLLDFCVLSSAVISDVVDSWHRSSMLFTSSERQPPTVTSHCQPSFTYLFILNPRTRFNPKSKHWVPVWSEHRQQKQWLQQAL